MKSNRLPGILLLSATIMILILIFLLYNSITNKTSPHGNSNSSIPFLVPFSYYVKSVSKDQAIINGNRGDMIIPNNSSVNVFFGNPTQTTPAIFSDLKVGQKVELMLSPGKATSIFILK